MDSGAGPGDRTIEKHASLEGGCKTDKGLPWDDTTSCGNIVLHTKVLGWSSRVVAGCQYDTTWAEKQANFEQPSRGDLTMDPEGNSDLLTSQ